MLLTKQILENYRACDETMSWYTSNGEPDSVEETIEKLLSSDECEKFDWSNWLLSRVLPLDDKIRYAIFAAELVIDIFEKEYPNDNRPRNAIETAREYLSNKDGATADAAYAAAREAYVANAVRAAACAACAAYAAAYAVRAAYDAAYVAADAARDAAAYAASAAAEATYVHYSDYEAADYAARADYTKIINYGLSLIEKCDDRCAKL